MSIGTTATKSKEPSNTKSGQKSQVRIIQNFLLVWLDESISINNNDDYRNSITKLRQVVNTVNTFTDVDECIDFITNVQHEKVFMIVSGTLSQIIVPIIEDISQVSFVYIFCENKTGDKQWAEEWSKVKGIFTAITPICDALKQDAQHCDQNMVSISFVKSSNDGTSNKDLDQLDSSFMYTQILKEILLKINFEQEHIDEFLKYCREQFAGNTSELENIDKLEREYQHHQPIWWYTYNSFLCSMLNRALRLMEVDLIIKMGFFVKDLHNHIVALHSEQYGGQNHYNSLTVYRGQGLSQSDFEQLMKTKGGLLSFNSFLSTSLDRAVSFAFTESNQYSSDMIGVFFEIYINPSILSTPFASIRDFSAYQMEEEILFSMHSIFRIGQITELDGNNRLWQVGLVLTNDNDPQLHALTRCLSEEIQWSTGWDQLGQLMIKLGHSNKAEELYEILLGQTTDECEKANIYDALGESMDRQGKYAEAVRTYEKGLEIYEKTLPPNHPDLARIYNHIGSVYYNMGEYSKALSYNENGLKIYKKTLPQNHPDLAASYINIGRVYDNMGEYSKALSYYEKALAIRQKTLPSNHPDLATSYNSIGLVYYNMGEYLKALSSHEKGLEIYEKTLPPNHPDLASSYNNIGIVYHNMGEYSKALSSHEKGLKICEKILPPNHPDLASSYNNIGNVYDNMREHSKALSCYEKALEIQQKTLPLNHPHLSTSYNNIGSVYSNMDEYSKALSFHEKGLEIYEKTLPPNHPSLATSYNNIGLVYFNMNEYSKALSYYERAVDIGQRSLSANHPNLEIFKQHLEIVKNRKCK